MPNYNFARIPSELQALAQWVVWRYEQTDSGKPTKVPYAPTGRWKASVTDPNTWGSFTEAVDAYSAFPNVLSGIGFVFTKNDPYCGVDLDATQNKAHVAQQRKIFEAFGSYSERSPSGQGLHIIIRADLPTGRRRNSIEIYSSGRFFTFTGDVFEDGVIEERQALATILWEEMGQVKSYGNYQGEIEEKYTDEEVIKQALQAINGDKFKILHEGRWQDAYSSQSEADFAYIDILAFYSRNRNQIVRLFRQSPLGQREKANRAAYVGYMLNKCFDRMLPPVDIEGLSVGVNDYRQAVQAQQSLPALTPPPIESNPYAAPPPGLLGEIANYIFMQAQKPVHEIAIAGAIAFLAGITGRAYNISGTGLNQYVICLAKTGRGKEAMASGIDKLMAAIKSEIPSAGLFQGPGNFASGAALYKHMANVSPCFASVLGEFGYRLQEITARNASAADVSLKGALLDLYSKSGQHQTAQSHVYSQKENNAGVCHSPSLTILGQSAPAAFLDAIDEASIASGLIPRFLVFEYKGERVRSNYEHEKAIISDRLKTQLIDITENCLRMAAGNGKGPQVTHVGMAPSAKKLADDFDRYADDKINANDNIVNELWNRAHLKVIKLAALAAVGCNYITPIIEDTHFQWARAIVEKDIELVAHKFDTGEIGPSRENGSNQQLKDLYRVLLEYVTRPYEQAAKPYQIEREMYDKAVVPFAYLSRRMLPLKSFRLAGNMAGNILKQIIQIALDEGVISEISKHQIQQEFKTKPSGLRHFAINDMGKLKM